MGAIGGLLGTSGGASGTGYNTPGSAGLQNPVQSGQATTAYGGVQGGLTAQQQLLQALQGQQGIQNQNQIYSQLQGIINGTGPNPAQAMLNQQTGQNVANQAALMAGQRGASANVGLLARQAAQQGAATQQQAVGQGATLQAQQALNALGGAGSLATTQAGQQIGQTNTNTQAQQAEQQTLLNQIAAQNNANVGMQSNINNANASLANTTMQGSQNIIGGIMNGGGAASSLLGGAAGGAQGGEVHKMAVGGPVNGPQSEFGQFLVNMQAPQPISPEMMSPYAPPNATAAAFKGSGKASASSVPNVQGSAGVLPGAGYVSQDLQPQGTYQTTQDMPNTVTAAKGGQVRSLVGGGGVKAANKAEKAVKSGNSYANDKIPAVLSEGEYVLDRATLQDKGPLGQAARNLVAAIKKTKGKS